MKILGTLGSSSYYDAESRSVVYRTDEVIEMDVKDSVASVPTPLPMSGYRPLDIPGLILEDRLPPSASLVSAKYEAASRICHLTTGVVSCRR